MTIRYIAEINDTTRQIMRLKPYPLINIPEEGLFNGVLIKYLTEADFESRASTAVEFIQKYYLNLDGNWALYPSKPNDISYWNRTLWAWDESMFWEKAREYRLELLYHSDWAILPDSPLTEEEKTEVRTYRQSLRDITSTPTRADGVWQDLPWPTKPSCLG
jgi:hypothetical protein